MKLLDLFFDRRCKLCGAEISALAVCDECDRELKSLINIRTRTFYINDRKIEGRYLFDYNSDKVKRLLFSLKQYADRDLFEYANCLYKEVIPENFSGVVTCCPRGSRGRRNYGYDQVALPCKMICKDSGGKYRFVRLLKRRGFSKEQKNLSLAERKKNTQGKFRVVKKDIPKNILLIDDVVTTGSTVITCGAEILKAFPDTCLHFAFLASRNGFSGK